MPIDDRSSVLPLSAYPKRGLTLGCQKLGITTSFLAQD